MSAVNQIQSGGTANTTRPIPKKELGKDDFLQLFITRLRYQNPLEPVNDEQFIAQMAQFSSLEQMQNMNSTLGQLLKSQKDGQDTLLQLLLVQGQFNQLSILNQAVSLLGKQVTIKDGQSSMVGTVEKVVSEQGFPCVVVNGQRYSLDQVIEVVNQVVQA